MDTDHPYPANPKIPTLLISIWYGLFAAITPSIILGGVVERTRFIPTVVFVFLWSTFVFDFLTYWTWNSNGWTYKLGALDFGGGTPVHLSTGAGALAFAYMVGKRLDTSEKPPHNMTHVVLGTSFIWLGWLVANAGSGISPNSRAVTVFITTNLSAAVGGVTWGVCDYFRHGRKWSALGFCSGVICGLVSVTPASGYVYVCIFIKTIL
jgi:Amt family ammonium transporter